MRENKQFASRMAAALAMATLIGTSAFAETRHSEETTAAGERDGVQSIQSLSGDESQNEARTEASRSDWRDQRGDDRGDRDNDRNRDRSRNDRDRDNDRYRNSDRYRNNDRYRNDRSYDRNRSHRNDNRVPYWAQGRVERVDRYRGGYHVYVHGARWPFFVPERHWNRSRFRIGIDVRLGGYYNSDGYFDYYDGRYAASRADLRGTVESVDRLRNTFVMRNDATDSFVTVFMRDRRRDLRAGDYVEVYGDWSRNGLFQAYDIDMIDRY